ncbi:RDD family protein [compost metagenome]
MDDLITNTLGGIIGFRIALWISGLLPQIEQLDSQVDLSTRRVTYTRRGIAAMLDSVIWLGAAGVLGLIQVPHPIWISLAVYFLLFPCFTRGRTGGKWLVRIRVEGPGSNLPLWRLTVRYGLLYGGMLGINSLLLEPAWIVKLAADQLYVVRGAVLLTDFFFLLHLVICMFKKQLLFYEVISRTRNVIIWPERLQQDEAESPANSIEL